MNGCTQIIQSPWKHLAAAWFGDVTSLVIFSGKEHEQYIPPLHSPYESYEQARIWTKLSSRSDRRSWCGGTSIRCRVGGTAETAAKKSKGGYYKETPRRRARMPVWVSATARLREGFVTSLNVKKQVHSSVLLSVRVTRVSDLGNFQFKSSCNISLFLHAEKRAPHNDLKKWMTSRGVWHWGIQIGPFAVRETHFSEISLFLHTLKWTPHNATQK